MLDQWSFAQGVEQHFIQPMQNGYIESYNGKFRDECLNENCFVSLSDVPADHRAMAAALQPGASALGIWATERRRSFEQK
jgi:hypothetical protein